MIATPKSWPWCKPFAKKTVAAVKRCLMLSAFYLSGRKWASVAYAYVASVASVLCLGRKNKGGEKVPAGRKSCDFPCSSTQLVE